MPSTPFHRQKAGGESLLRMGLASRLAGSLVLSGLIWLGVAWAVGRIPI